MKIPVAQFIVMDASSVYLPYSNKKVFMTQENSYVIEDIDRAINSDELIQLLNHGIVNFYDSVPELQVFQPSHGSLPYNVYIEQLNLGLRKKYLQEKGTNNKTTQKLEKQVNKTNVLVSRPIRILAINFILPGTGYLMTKRYTAFALYLINLILLAYTTFLLTGNLLVIMIVLASINYFISIRIYKDALFSESFGVKKGGHVAANPLALLPPVFYIVIQLMNIIFINGKMFDAAQKIYYQVMNQIWLNVFKKTFFVYTEVITFKNIVLPSLTNTFMYFIIYVFLALITALWLILFRKGIIKKMEENSR